MRYEQLEVTLEGLTPTLMHNGQLADPLNKWTKAIKEISGKRKKTDADHAELARLEWFGSLYLNDDGRPAWPGENIEALLIAAAKKRKEGPQAKTGVLCDGSFPIVYSGPSDAEKLWQDENFRLTARVGIQRASVMRTRPIFRDWSLHLVINFLPDVVNEKTVREWCDIGGQLVGLSDWRPKYGRYSVK